MYNMWPHIKYSTCMYVCTCVRIFTYRLFKHLRVSFVIGTARWQASTNIFQLIFLARSTESCYLFTVEKGPVSIFNHTILKFKICFSWF